MIDRIPIIHLDSRVPALLSLVVRPLAVTLGRHIFVRRGVIATARLLRHEAVHVAQFAELGWIRFFWLYVTDWIRAWLALRDRRAAYRAIRLEQEARALEDLEDREVPWEFVIVERAPRGWQAFDLPPRP